MSSAPKGWLQSQAANRRYQEGYEVGFERGSRAGVAADRLHWFGIGIIAGGLVTFLARTFI